MGDKLILVEYVWQSKKPLQMNVKEVLSSDSKLIVNSITQLLDVLGAYHKSLVIFGNSAYCNRLDGKAHIDEDILHD